MGKQGSQLVSPFPTKPALQKHSLASSLSGGKSAFAAHKPPGVVVGSGVVGAGVVVGVGVVVQSAMQQTDTEAVL